MNYRLITTAAACLMSLPTMAYERTDAEYRVMFKEIIRRSHYECPEIKSMDIAAGYEKGLLILCGPIDAETGDRKMAYIVDVARDNHVTKADVAPRNFWEWVADWF